MRIRAGLLLWGTGSTGMTELNPPFGAYGLPAWAEAVRRLGERAPSGRLGMHAASLLRRISLMGGREPYDIEAWPGVNARIHPSDNRCEKRVFCAPHLWDRAELEALEAALAAAPAERAFTFMDLGANVGFYSLYLDAAARRTGRSARIVAAEPDTENRRRLEANAAASGAQYLDVYPVALGARAGRASLVPPGRNRGEVRIDAAAADGEVEVLTVLALAERAGLPHIDAIKLDLEGQDEAVLTAFLNEAPAALRPGLLIVETAGQGGARIARLAAAHGYDRAATTRTNAIFRLNAGAA